MVSNGNEEYKIIPLKDALKGVDILGTRYTYIIRSDLGRFIKVEKVEKGKDSEMVSIFPLHDNCLGGDHYFGFYHNYELVGGSGMYDSFFMLKGNEFRNVRSLTTDEAAKTGTLHPKCRGGDFYMATAQYHHYSSSGIFIVIRAKETTFEVYSNLETGEPSTQYKRLYKEVSDNPYYLHANCKGGLYYWATKSKTYGIMRYYILKGVNKYGLVRVHRTENLRTDEKGEDISLSFPMSISLPGLEKLKQRESLGEDILSTEASEDSRPLACDVCTDTIATTEGSIQCKECSQSMHRMCAGLTRAEYKEFIENQMYDFVCRTCNLRKQSAKIEELSQELAELQAKLKHTEHFPGSQQTEEEVHIFTERVHVRNLGKPPHVILETPSNGKPPTNSLVPTLREASEILNEVVHEWHKIALQLNFEGHIKRIEFDHGNKGSERCLIEVLDIWIRQTVPQPTWTELASALDKLGHKKLALRIRQEYKITEE